MRKAPEEWDFPPPLLAWYAQPGTPTPPPPKHPSGPLTASIIHTGVPLHKVTSYRAHLYSKSLRGPLSTNTCPPRDIATHTQKCVHKGMHADVDTHLYTSMAISLHLYIDVCAVRHLYKDTCTVIPFTPVNLHKYRQRPRGPPTGTLSLSTIYRLEDGDVHTHTIQT